jgi:hypothetical protein
MTGLCHIALRGQNALNSGKTRSALAGSLKSARATPQLRALTTPRHIATQKRCLRVVASAAGESSGSKELSKVNVDDRLGNGKATSAAGMTETLFLARDALSSYLTSRG